MTHLRTGFRIHGLDPEILAVVRADGRDVSGTPVEHVVATGGEPVRCCLRNADAGDELILFGYEPRLPSRSPYREIGAVYAHAATCPAQADPDSYPSDWSARPQVLRAYDERGWIHPATTKHDGTDPVGALQQVLAQPGVVEVHSRNIDYGCFMFSATRTA